MAKQFQAIDSFSKQYRGFLIAQNGSVVRHLREASKTGEAGIFGASASAEWIPFDNGNFPMRLQNTGLQSSR
jgi:hypothetical protein